MNKVWSIVTVMLLALSCSSSRTNGSLMELKTASRELSFPKPVVYFTKGDKKNDAAGAQQISDDIVSKTSSFLQKEHEVIPVSVNDDQYGYKLQQLMQDLEDTEDISRVQIDQYLKDLTAQERGDLGLFFYEIADTEYGTEISAAVYSKQKDEIVYYKSIKNSGDPLQDKTVQKQVSAVLNGFLF